MSISAPKQKTATVQEVESWEGHWELIHGVAYAMAPPSREHQAVSSRLHIALGNALAEAGEVSCEVYAAPTGLYLPGAETLVEPDLMVVCDPAKKSDRGIEGPPELVVEIISPNTAGVDQTRKRWLYESSGVPEYLMIHPADRISVLLRLAGTRYEEATRLAWGTPLPLLAGRIRVPIL